MGSHPGHSLRAHSDSGVPHSLLPAPQAPYLPIGLLNLSLQLPEKGLPAGCRADGGLAGPWGLL